MPTSAIYTSVDCPIEILKFNKKFFKKLYLWPEPKKYYVLGWLMLMYMTLPAMLVDLIITLHKKQIKLSDFAEHLVELITIVLSTYLYIMNRYIQNDFLNIYKRLTQLQIYHQNDHGFLMEAESLTKLLTQGLFGFAIVLCHPTFTSIPLLTYKECKENINEIMEHNFTRYIELPVCGLELKGRYPFDVNNNAWLWLIIEISQVIGGIATTSIPAIVTLLLVEMVIYLIFEINNLKKFIVAICESGISVQEMTRRLEHSLKYHAEIIEIADMMNDSFGLVFAVHFLLFGIGISLLTLAIAMGDQTEMMRLSMELNAWIFVLFIPNHYGQQLINESEDISRAVYETNWYEAPVNIRKALLLIMVRSQRSLRFQSNSLSIFCYASFVGVMKSSYSLFNLVTSAHKEDES